MDIPGRTISSTRDRFPRTVPHSGGDSPQSPHLTNHSLRNPFLLLCINRRIIFRSICTSHLLLAFGTCCNRRTSVPTFCIIAMGPLYLPINFVVVCVVVEGDQHVSRVLL